LPPTVATAAAGSAKAITSGTFVLTRTYPSRLVDPPLTTVDQPMRLLGERACARLLDRIACPSLRPTVELLPTELVLGQAAAARPGR
jgi:DNA-binding LacI/PurR family transcriptional regulator